MEIEPNLGVPVNMQIRFQVNLLLQRDTAFPPLAHLKQDFSVLPLFWAQEGYDTIPDSTLTLIDVAILAPQLATWGLISSLLLLGGALISASSINYCKQKRAWKSINTYYDANMATTKETLIIPSNKRYERQDLRINTWRKSSDDNTATTASLLNSSKNSSKIAISNSFSSSSLSSTRNCPLSDSSLATVSNSPCWMEEEHNKISTLSQFRSCLLLCNAYSQNFTQFNILFHSYDTQIC